MTEPLPTQPQIVSCDLKIVPLVAMSPTRGGALHVADLGPARWSVRYETAPLSKAQQAAWRAWLARRQHGGVSFWAHNPFDGPPAGTATGNTITFASTNTNFAASDWNWGTAAHTLGGPWRAVSGSGRSLVVSGFTAGALLPAGARVGVVWPGARRLYETIADARADSSGRATLTLNRILPGSAPWPATVELVRPTFEAAIIYSTVDMPSGLANTRLSFEAVEIIRSA